MKPLAAAYIALFVLVTGVVSYVLILGPGDSRRHTIVADVTDRPTPRVRTALEQPAAPPEAAAPAGEGSADTAAPAGESTQDERATWERAKDEAAAEQSVHDEPPAVGTEIASTSESPGEPPKEPAETIIAPERAESQIPVPAEDGDLKADVRRESSLLPVQAALLEAGQDGPLPRIAEDGRKPWQVYARAAKVETGRPRIAVIIGDLGLSAEATMRAIEDLPPEVTLAFSPYGRKLAEYAQSARAAGHEILVIVPMEPAESAQDPGPHALRTDLSAAENQIQYKWILSRLTGYVGIMTDMGSRFTTKTKAIRPVLEETRSRGLLFVDSYTTRKSVAPKVAKSLEVPLAFADIRLDGELVRATIDAHLLEAEVVARLKGAAVVRAPAHPVVVDRIARWIPVARKNGMALVPITGVANLQKVR